MDLYHIGFLFTSCFVCCFSRLTPRPTGPSSTPGGKLTFHLFKFSLYLFVIIRMFVLLNGDNMEKMLGNKFSMTPQMCWGKQNTTATAWCLISLAWQVKCYDRGVDISRIAPDMKKKAKLEGASLQITNRQNNFIGHVLTALARKHSPSWVQHCQFDLISKSEWVFNGKKVKKIWFQVCNDKEPREKKESEMTKLELKTCKGVDERWG